MNKILIGIPSRGFISVGTANFLLANKDKDAFFGCSSLSVECARRQIVSYFLENKYEYLFFLDDDVRPERDCIERLIGHSLDMVCSPYPILRCGERFSCVYNLNNKIIRMNGDGMGKKSLEEISACGLGACLIRREVFEKIIVSFQMQYDERGIMVKTDDIMFCERVRNADIPIYADFDCPSEHYKQICLNTIESGGGKCPSENLILKTREE